MKLYATITSERASKGQGGSRELVINIKVGNKSRREIANIVLTTTGGSTDGSGNTYALEYYPVNRDRGGRVILDSDVLEKGEKQKGEYHCEKHAWHCSGEGSYPCPHCK